MPNQRKLEWSPWLAGGEGGSRNLTRIAGGLEKTVESLHIGAEDVVKAIVNLPITKHDLNGPPENFCVDAFPVLEGQRLLLNVHGQFTECGTEGIRSFDRTFILAIAPEGSRAKTNGWDVVILSDQWRIRAYSSPAAWKPGPMLVQAQPSSRHRALPIAPSSGINQTEGNVVLSMPPDQRELLASIPEPQQKLVIKLCQETRLNVKYSVDCLTSNQWDFDRAVLNFDQVKATLPPDAFL
jgi:nuclear RNA export factor